MAQYVKFTRKYLSGPSVGEEETVYTWVGPAASIVIEAQERRGGAPLIRKTVDGDIVHEFGFQIANDEELE